MVQAPEDRSGKKKRWVLGATLLFSFSFFPVFSLPALAETSLVLDGPAVTMTTSGGAGMWGDLLDLQNGASYDGLWNGTPTLVELMRFVATVFDDHVLLEWATASELDTAGFNLWRKRVGNPELVHVNPALIPARGGPSAGAEYAFADYGVVPDAFYEYQLEEIETTGHSYLHPLTVSTASEPNPFRGICAVTRAPGPGVSVNLLFLFVAAGFTGLCRWFVKRC